MEAQFDALTSDERLRLLRFVCSFAWADLEIAEAEITYVKDLVRRLELDDDESDQVEAWLDLPPDPDDVDPTEIPREHREVFLKTVLEIVMIDGRVDPGEVENFAIFEQLLR